MKGFKEMATKERMMNNKARNYNKIYKKIKNAKKCIFCCHEAQGCIIVVSL